MYLSRYFIELGNKSQSVSQFDINRVGIHVKTERETERETVGPTASKRKRRTDRQRQTDTQTACDRNI